MTQNNHSKPPGFGFPDRLSALCAMELSDCRGDPDRTGAMIERLINALGFTIAIAAEGDPGISSTMLEGAVAYLTEAVLEHAKTGAFMTHNHHRH